MKKLVTNSPKRYTDRIRNMVFVKNKDVYLRRFGKGGSNIKLVDWCKKQCCEKCKSMKNVKQLEDYEENIIECNCIVAYFYWACVGFAQVRERLKYYEDNL